MCGICERLNKEQPGEDKGFTLVRYVLGRNPGFIDAPMADEDEVYVNGELDPTVHDGAEWEHYPYADIVYYCAEHRHQEVTRDRPCPLCGPEVRAWPAE